MGKKLVLFVCIHNSARSQMAQAYLKQSRAIVLMQRAPVLRQERLILWRSKRWQKSASTYQGTPRVVLLIF